MQEKPVRRAGWRQHAVKASAAKESAALQRISFSLSLCLRVAKVRRCTDSVRPSTGRSQKYDWRVVPRLLQNLLHTEPCRVKAAPQSSK